MQSPEAKSTAFERTSEFVKKIWWKECLIQFCRGRSLAVRFSREMNKLIWAQCHYNKSEKCVEYMTQKPSVKFESHSQTRGIEPKKGWNYDDYPVCYRWVKLIKICQHTKWKGLLKHHTCGHNNNHNSDSPKVVCNRHIA